MVNHHYCEGNSDPSFPPNSHIDSPAASRVTRPLPPPIRPQIKTFLRADLDVSEEGNQRALGIWSVCARGGERDLLEKRRERARSPYCMSLRVVVISFNADPTP